MPTPLTRLARIADGVVAALVLLSAILAATGGGRIRYAGWHLSLTDPIRPLALAAMIAVFRHWLVWTPTIVERLRRSLRPTMVQSHDHELLRPLPDLASRNGRGGVARRAAVVLLLALVALSTWHLVPSPGTSDVSSYWIPWMHNVRDFGLVKGYEASRSDYPAGTAVVLTATVTAQRVTGLSDFIALKLTILLFLCLTTLVFWRWTGHFALSMLLHAPLMVEGLGLSYVDVFFAPLFVGALWALERRRLVLFGVLFTASWLTKWQPLILAPIAIVWLGGIDRLADWRLFRWRDVTVGFLAPAVAIGSVALARFGMPLANALDAATGHIYFSGYALNFCWVVTHWVRAYRPDAFGGLTGGLADMIQTRALAYTALPKMLFVMFFMTAVVLTLRRPKTYGNFLRFSLIAYLAYFTFNTGVHENHWFLAVILATALAWRDRRHLATAIIVALFSVVNLVLFYGWNGTGNRVGRLVFGVDAALPLAILAVVLYLWSLITVVRQSRAIAPAVLSPPGQQRADLT